KKEIYTGKIYTEKHEYTIQIRLRQSDIYRKGIEELYQAFIRNGVIWTTLNCPYVEKFADVHLIGIDEKMELGEEIIDIQFDLGEYNRYQKRDMVPLWNVKTVLLPSLTFPVPADDHVNYQHEVTLEKEGTEHGYLVCLDESFNGYVKRREDTLTLIAPVSNMSNWEIKKVVTPPKETTLRSNIYDLMTNQTQNSFINRFSKKQGKVIRTKAELVRVIQSFEVAKSIHLVEFTIMDSSKKKKESYPMDFFLVDEIREQNSKKILLLDFQAEEFDFLTRDKISFLVSELQQYFPEYLCEGRLLS
uniref:normocyte-binding protein n=1 Tax=Anaerosporobacter sp. TaxID=1872529 RepID=UPI00286F76E0